jgi:hypothetical protein
MITGWKYEFIFSRFSPSLKKESYFTTSLKNPRLSPPRQISVRTPFL